jgi:filamentous hemagglutinin family protein
MSCKVKAFDRYKLGRIILCLLLCPVIGGVGSVVIAGPEGAQVINGQVTIQQSGLNTTINASDQSIINYNSFDIARPEVVRFIQPGSDASVLNRILSANPTTIEGTLTANGRVFFVNPAGVLIGPSASINVNQLVASGLNISNADFLNGRYEFAGGAGAVINNGDISAQSVYLVGAQVTNAGHIRCPAGYVVMAAGERVFLGEPGSNVVVDISSLELPDVAGTKFNNTVTNTGTVEAGDGRIVLAAAGDAASSVIENFGGLLASSGTVSASASCVGQYGTINVDGTEGDGGNIELTGSELVELGPDSLTAANGGLNGDGGTVLAVAEGKTTFESGARIEARGGELSGDGGFVEISGRTFNFAGEVDLSAAFGEPGRLLIDPLDITIADGYAPAEPPDNTVYEKWIEEQSVLGVDLDLFSYGSIFVEHITDYEITGGSGDISLRTVYNTGGIEFYPEYVDGPITTRLHTTDGGGVFMLAGAGGITVGDITTDTPSEDKLTEPGRIRLFTNNGGDIQTGALTVDGGSDVEVSVISSGNLTIDGGVVTKTNQVPSNAEGKAKTCLVADGSVDITGPVVVQAHGKTSTEADIHICAGRDVTVSLAQNEQIEAYANTTEAGSADASVLIHAGKNVEGPGTITISGGKPIHVKAKAGGGYGSAEVYSSDDPSQWDETDNQAHAMLEIDADYTGECPDCPRPPELPEPIPPIGEPDSGETHMNNALSGNVLDNDTHPDPGGELTAELVDGPSHGTLTLNSDGSYNYQPDTGYVGTDSFTYIATDGTIATEPILVTITITNTLPEVTNDSASIHMNDSVIVDISDNVSDADGDPLSIGVGDPANGTLTANPDGTYTYQPDTGYTGGDSFTFTASDGEIGATPAGGLVTITIGNESPTATNESVETNMNEAVSGSLADNVSDPDGDPVTTSLAGGPQNGQVSLNPDGSYTYTPAAGFVGEDSFIFSASDGELGAPGAYGTVSITVIGEETPQLQTLSEQVSSTTLPATISLEQMGSVGGGGFENLVWLAMELGLCQGDKKGENQSQCQEITQAYLANAFLQATDLQPYRAATRLRELAAILHDTDGSRIAALTEVVNQFVAAPVPPSEEQMASIAAAIANPDSEHPQYAMAGEWLDSLAEYVNILDTEIGWPADESVAFVMNKYGTGITEQGNVSVIAFVQMHLEGLGG